MTNKIKAFLVDDEPLALRRLSRLLAETGRVQIVESTSDALHALAEIPVSTFDVLFLDIQMPGLNGFELLARLERYPPVIFTTAFDEFALRAFEVYSLDYLLKPVEAERLEKALDKLEKLRQNAQPHFTEVQKLLEKMALSVQSDEPKNRHLERLPSRVGGRVQFVEITEITHFFAQDKLVFANTIAGKQFPLDFSIVELEKKLDSRIFVRVHRNALINSNFIDEVHGWFTGRVLVRLKDVRRTELVVARDRVRILKDFLGM